MQTKYSGTILTASILLLFGLFLAVRSDGLFEHCLWFDEIYSSHAASMHLSDMFPFIAKDLVHPPLFYFLLNLWISVFGSSIESLRLFPFSISIVALIPAYLLLRQLKVGSTAVVGGLLFVAANGILIKYAQEVRMYALVVGLSFASTLLFHRFFRMGKGIIALTIINGLLLMTHYYGAVLIIAQLLAIVTWQRIKLRPIVGSAAVATLSIVPWLVYVLGIDRGGDGGLKENIGWIPFPGLFVVINSFLDFTEPIYFDMSTAELPTNPLISIPMLALIAVSVFLGIRKGGANDLKNGEGLFPELGVFVFGLIISFTLSLILPYSVWGTRHLLVLFGPFLALFAVAISEKVYGELKAIPIATLSAIVLMAIGFGFLQPRENRYLWCAWERFAVYLKDRPNGDAPIYFADDLAAYHFWYFSNNDSNRKIVLVKNDSFSPSDEAYFLPRGFSGVQRQENLDYSKPFLFAFTAKTWDVDSETLNELRKGGCDPQVLEVFEANGRKAFLVRCDQEGV
jgi:hypothetical protein